MTIEGVSEFGKWKMSSAALWIRYRRANNLCGGCGEHEAGTWCKWLRGIWVEPPWVDEILRHYDRGTGPA